MKDAELKVEFVTSKLNEKKNEIKANGDRIQAINNELSESYNKKDLIDEEIRKCNYNLFLANKYLKCLFGEKTRWRDKALKYKKEQEHLTLTCILNSFFINYLGAYEIETRFLIIDEAIKSMSELNIKLSKTCFIDMLPEIQRQEFHMNKLPED